MSVGVNSRGSLAQTGGGGPSGAGASLGWRGFSAHTSAASSARGTATHASALREGPEFAGGAPESVRRDFAKDIRVHALERDTLVHDLQGERHGHARGRQTGVVVVGLIGELSLERVTSGRNRGSDFQPGAHDERALVNRERCVRERKLLRLTLRVNDFFDLDLLGGLELEFRRDQIFEARVVIVNVIARGDAGLDGGFQGRARVRGVGREQGMRLYDRRSAGALAQRHPRNQTYRDRKKQSVSHLRISPFLTRDKGGASSLTRAQQAAPLHRPNTVHYSNIDAPIRLIVDAQIQFPFPREAQCGVRTYLILIREPAVSAPPRSAQYSFDKLLRLI